MIEVRRFDDGVAVASQISVPLIVCQHEDDIRRPLGARGNAGLGEAGGQEEMTS
jgi:hypothetical protein